MTQERYWGSAVSVEVHEALLQCGCSWGAHHQENAIADSGSVDILINVQSACHVEFAMRTTGTFHGAFSVVGSVRASASVASLTTWNRNLFFQAANSGQYSTLFSHTASYASGVVERWPLLIPGGVGVGAIGGNKKQELILAPGLYTLQMQNKSGGAADFIFEAHWEEPAIPETL